VSVVDTSPWSGEYYLTGNLQGGYVTVVPSSFDVTARVPECVIVKGAEENDPDEIEESLFGHLYLSGVKKLSKLRLRVEVDFSE
jgi:hypothetical protein